MKLSNSLIIAFIVLFLSLQVFGQENKISANKISKENYATPADSIAPDHSKMRYITSVELAKEMSPGWNVGNSLEAIGGETAWGNPLITQKLIDSIKAAGFKSVRIPVAWSRFTDATNFVIDEKWLARVEEVVNYVLRRGMYAIINEHWDSGWIQPTYAKQQYVNNRLSVMWKQIAAYFRDYDDHLLFAGTNEVMVDGNYGTPTPEYYGVQNGYNQVFVNAVRSTGGKNYYRYILVQGFNTNIDNTNNFFVMPKDVTESRLMVEVHYYDPYNFTINANSTITQWGKNATDPKKTETWANEAWADGQFLKMKTKFIDKGYAVILGEYGTLNRINLGSTALNNEYAGYRKYYSEYVTGSMAKNGLVPMIWDNGGTGNNGMGLFNRSTGAKVYPDIIKAIVDAVKLNTDVQEINSLPVEFKLMQNYPNPFNPDTNISYQLSSSSNVSLKVYDLLGREIATLVNEFKPAGIYNSQFSILNLPAGRQGSQLTSGVYFYILNANNFTETKKMLLVK